MGGTVVAQFKRQLVLWREEEALVDVVDRAIEILALQRVAMVVVLAIHHIEVMGKSIFYEVLNVFEASFSSYRRALVPVEPRPGCVVFIITLPIRRCLVNVLKLVDVLRHSTTLIEELLVLSVIFSVIFAEGHMSPIVPRRHVSHSHSW